MMTDGKNSDSQRARVEADFRATLTPKERAQQIEEGVTEINGYRLKKKIGEGGFGDVYLAEHKPLGGDSEQIGPMGKAAIKVLFCDAEEDSAGYQLFKIEVQALKDLRGAEHVVHVRDVALYDKSLPCIIMDHFDGETLSDFRGQHPLAPQVAKEILSQILEALIEVETETRKRAGSTHEDRGIAHGDITPQNVLIKRDGKRKFEIKVIDFGVATLYPLRQRTDEGITQTKPTVAEMTGYTPGYHSPEMAMSHNITPASDLFQVGLIGFDLLTGTPYWEASRRQGNCLKRLSSLPPWFPSKKSPDKKSPDGGARRNVGWGMKRALTQALNWDPQHRFIDAASFKRAMKYPLWDHLLRHWSAYLLLVLLVLAPFGVHWGMSSKASDDAVSMRNKDMEIRNLQEKNNGLQNEVVGFKEEIDDLRSSQPANERAMYLDAKAEFSDYRDRPNSEQLDFAIQMTEKYLQKFGSSERAKRVREWRDWLIAARYGWSVEFRLPKVEAHGYNFGWFNDEDVHLQLGVKRDGNWCTVDDPDMGNPHVVEEQDVDGERPLSKNAALGHLKCTYGDTIALYYDVDGKRKITWEQTLNAARDAWECVQAVGKEPLSADGGKYRVTVSFQPPDGFRPPPEP